MAAANSKSVLASGMMSVATDKAANGPKLLQRLLFRRGLVGRRSRVHKGVWKRRVDLNQRLVRLLGSRALIDCA